MPKYTSDFVQRDRQALLCYVARSQGREQHNIQELICHPWICIVAQQSVRPSNICYITYFKSNELPSFQQMNMMPWYLNFSGTVNI